MTPHGPAQIGICKLDQPLPPEARVMPGMHDGEGQARKRSVLGENLGAMESGRLRISRLRRAGILRHIYPG
jgi:hypothetical protein